MSEYPKVFRNGELVSKSTAGPRHDGPVRNIIKDDLPGGSLVNHADGKRYSSKAAFRAATRAKGLIEVGNERQVERREWQHADTRPDIKRAIEELGG